MEETTLLTTAEPCDIKIYCGLKNTFEQKIGTYSLTDVHEIVQEYVNKLGECVTITPTNFVYTNGNEPGVIIGFINYPRFPKDQSELITRALGLAEKLMYAFKQCRVTVTTPISSIMLTNTTQIKENEKSLV